MHKISTLNHLTQSCQVQGLADLKVMSDKGAWHAAVHEVSVSDTTWQLNNNNKVMLGCPLGGTDILLAFPQSTNNVP